LEVKLLKANEIRAAMKRKEKGVVDLAKEIGMAPNSLSRKLVGKSQFTIAEAVKLVKVLEIDNPVDIFFS
jgi:plasmid maintenance system antidote protein VapI